ncbi:MAG TPA: hypothetical protein VNJ08_08045 [Bacteriovoracaceae bacterium]|nr:hypothetical protein [Bacteriovoracaceae bacterium]
MKLIAGLLLLGTLGDASAQAWKTLPKGVRILGYRNVTTSTISSNFNRFGADSPLGTQFRVDAGSFNDRAGNVVTPGADVDANAYNALVVGEYKVDASAQVNAQGTGFGIGLSDRVMFFASVAYYKAVVKTDLKRTKGNTYEETANILRASGGTQNDVIAENLRHMIDVNERTIQSVITNHYGYKPLGDWYGSGYGDLETGLMIKAADEGETGLMFYPGVVLPTGYQDDPDILQDIAFGDGQFDFFGELATGYLYNDHLMFGTSFRYTYQAPTTKRLRVPHERDFTLSETSERMSVKYGDKLDWMLNTTFSFNDWISVTPIYRFMYQMPSKYGSTDLKANEYLAYNSDKLEHQVQLTTSFSSIAPFLKKNFILPAQININLVKTVAGKNVANAGRFEVEFRMLF